MHCIIWDYLLMTEIEQIGAIETVELGEAGLLVADLQIVSAPGTRVPREFSQFTDVTGNRP